MPASLDLNGLLGTLQAAAAPVPGDPLDALAASEATARDRMRIFDPACTSDPAPRVAARPMRRAGG